MNKDHSEDEEAKKRAEVVKATTSQNLEESRHVIRVAKQRIAEAKRMIRSTRKIIQEGITQNKPGPSK